MDCKASPTTPAQASLAVLGIWWRVATRMRKMESKRPGRQLLHTQPSFTHWQYLQLPNRLHHI